MSKLGFKTFCIEYYAEQLSLFQITLHPEHAKAHGLHALPLVCVSFTS